VLRHHDYAELQANGARMPAASLQHIALALAAESIFVKHELGAASMEWTLGGAFALEQLRITQAELDGIAADITAELAAH
jgi:hypothetical protein